MKNKKNHENGAKSSKTNENHDFQRKIANFEIFQGFCYLQIGISFYFLEELILNYVYLVPVRTKIIFKVRCVAVASLKF